MKHIFVFIFVFFAVVVSAQQTLSLNKTWEFRKAGTDNWFKAEVPGTIHTDLLANKLIPDPFYRDNESKVQWVENESWEYRTSFDVPKELMQQKHLEIQFDGLDTYAEVYLNGKKIISADNMFRQWVADIKPIAKPKANTLLIVFPPSATLARLAKKADSIARPDNERVYVRKAQYQFGWDWGPRLVTCGIWKDVRLVGWNDLYIESVYPMIYHDSVHVHLEVLSDTTGEFYLTAFDNYDTIGPPKFIPPPGLIGEAVFLKKGFNSIIIKEEKSLLVRGDPDKQYDITFGIEDTTLYSGKYPTQTLRFRKPDIRLRQERDTAGESFYFTIHDKPTFIKGVNWIPSESFLPRAKKLKRYEQLIKAAKEANINMLRVWGGGVYEDDLFYELCDKYGIMVWQDFMFAGAMYPADSSFLKNVEEEVRYQVKRLRNHPCIAIWCGNNEIEEAWFNWGWQKQFNYSDADSLKLWNDYKKIFHELIPNILQELDPQRPYWPSSPSLGWGRDSAYKKGDVHYWGVWWGKEPVEKYNEKVGRFVSEYGMQGMPDMRTMKQFALPHDMDTSSAVMRIHQKHPFGWENIKYYIGQKFRTPKSFEDLVYVSQLMQADAIKTAIEAHRRNKPTTMGTMFWQWNDCWPVTSWSAVDYYGRKKALYYQVKRSFAPVIITTKKTTEGYEVGIISDDSTYHDLDYMVDIYDLRTGKSKNGSYPDSNVPILIDVKTGEENTRNSYFTKEQMSSTMAHITLKDGDRLLASQFLFFSDPKKLNLAKPKITYTVTNSSIQISSNLFAYGVYIDVPDGVELDDNYFHLAPNEKKIINFTSSIPLEQLKKNIRIKSLVDTY